MCSIHGQDGGYFGTGYEDVQNSLVLHNRAVLQHKTKFTLVFSFEQLANDPSLVISGSRALMIFIVGVPVDNTSLV